MGTPPATQSGRASTSSTPPAPRGWGLSLVLIHIYVTPIKRFLQALWALGVVGSVGTYLAAAQPLDEGLVQYVAGASGGDVVRWADLCCPHRPRVQGR
ncbi:hypothetical protein PR202_gb10244 [Eleusine coracana subsp. coracana]|uniref:Uncharacterized protein n=1 Tax=Eleusine coracana subsp. coracana TaxID=191504 RepID=A0AAV5EJF4_ELECO|nr:hypothetical protein PR202_gb10244 [Eleusine coracana subsp. coracana]